MVRLKSSILDYLLNFEDMSLVLWGFIWGYFCIFPDFFKYTCVRLKSFIIYGIYGVFRRELGISRQLLEWFYAIEPGPLDPTEPSPVLTRKPETPTDIALKKRRSISLHIISRQKNKKKKKDSIFENDTGSVVRKLWRQHPRWKVSTDPHVSFFFILGLNDQIIYIYCDFFHLNCYFIIPFCGFVD